MFLCHFVAERGYDVYVGSYGMINKCGVKVWGM